MKERRTSESGVVLTAIRRLRGKLKRRTDSEAMSKLNNTIESAAESTTESSGLNVPASSTVSDIGGHRPRKRRLSAAQRRKIKQVRVTAGAEAAQRAEAKAIAAAAALTLALVTASNVEGVKVSEGKKGLLSAEEVRQQLYVSQIIK